MPKFMKKIAFLMAVALSTIPAVSIAGETYVTTVTHCKDNGSCIETTTVYVMDAWGGLKIVSQTTRVFQRSNEVK